MGAAIASAATSIPWAMGFTNAGVVTGSLAASTQSAIGLVSAGSWFAGMQSVAATTVLGTPVGLGIGATVIVGRVLGFL